MGGPPLAACGAPGRDLFSSRHLTEQFESDQMAAVLLRPAGGIRLAYPYH